LAGAGFIVSDTCAPVWSEVPVIVAGEARVFCFGADIIFRVPVIRMGNF
jgi:hypothetical protein